VIRMNGYALLAVALLVLGTAAWAENADLEPFERAVEVNPKDSQAQFNLGVMALKDGDFERAARALKETTHLSPKDAEAWEAYGAALSGAGDADGAVAALETASQLEPKKAEVWERLGGALVKRLGRTDDPSGLKSAIDAFEKAVQLAPKNPQPAINEALLWMKLGQDAKALPLLNRAAGLPGGEDAYRGLCVLRNKSGAYAQASAACASATAASPGDAESWYNLGFALQRLGRSGEARNAYQSSVLADPAHAAALYALAFMDFQAGDADRALKGFQAALAARHGDYPEAQYNAAVLLGDQGRYEEAAELYRTLLKRDPADEDAKANLAAVMEMGLSELLERGKDAYEKGDFSEARLAWERAAKLDPGNGEAGRLLNLAKVRNDAAERAASSAREKVAHTLEERQKAEDEAVRERGVSAFDAGHYAEAIRLLDFYLRKAPGDRKAGTLLVKARGRLRAEADEWLREGEAALNAGDHKQAGAFAAKALEVDPANRRALALKRDAGAAPPTAVPPADPEEVRRMYYAGVEQYLAGNLAAAVVTWKQVLRMEPDHLDAKRSLERAEMELQALKERGKG